MNIEQIRREIGPEAAKLAARFRQREESRKAAELYASELARQMQQMQPWIAYLQRKHL